MDKHEFSVWRFFDHMVSALEYLQSQEHPIIHRDLKPDNILGKMSASGLIQWKIADFGIAWVLHENAYGEIYARTQLGTPIYMAPEALLVRNSKIGDIIS